MVKIQVNNGKGETTINTNNVWDRIVALEDNVKLQDGSKISEEFDKINSSMADIVTVNARMYSSLQAAHDYIKNNYNYGILLIPNDMTITDTLTWDVSKVSIQGYGVTVTANIDDSSKYAIKTISSETSNPYKQVTTSIDGVKFKGNDICNGILFDGGTGNNGSAHVSILKSNFNNFKNAITYGTHGYCINFIACDIFENDIAITSIQGATDMGERLTYFGCTIFNNNIGIYAVNGETYHLTNCSLDYNRVNQIKIDNGRIFISDSHLEGKISEYTSTNRPYVVGNSTGNLLQIINSKILLNNPAGNGNLDYLFENNLVGTKAGVIIDRCFISGIYTTTGYLATGVGRTIVKGSSEFDTTTSASITASGENLLLDGGFENANIIDNMFVYKDSTAITSRSVTGTNISLTTSTDTFRSGTKSLKLHKVGGVGSEASLMLLVPIEKNVICGWELYLKRASSSVTGSINVYAGYAADNRADVINPILSQIDSIAVTLDATMDVWLKEKNGATRKKAPSWANYFYIIVRGFNMSAGDLYIDDIVITQM